MPELVERGTMITLDALFTDSLLVPTDAVNPKVSIVDAEGATLVNLANPTTHPAVGHYQYQYMVPIDAAVGAWEATWYGLIGGLETGPIDDGFTVVAQNTLTPLPASSRICSSWSTADAIKACSACATVDAGLLATQLEVASELLYALSTNRFPGVCEMTVRPCARQIRNDGPHRFHDFGMRFALPDGTVDGVYTAGGGIVVGGCGCNDARTCGCGGVSEITLGAWPIVAITEVKVDGVVLDPARYRVDDRRYLVRLPNADGSRAAWPCCQDIALPSTEVNTFEVTFTYGQAPPASGARAAEVLACELALACTGGECSLPSGIRSQIRQGVATEFIAPADLLSNGMTGLREVDLFLLAFGPSSKKRLPSAIVNPDIHRAVRRAGT